MEGDVGVGVLGFHPRDPELVFLVSEPWPREIRLAMAESAARAASRGSTGLRMPMPTAELFGGWAVAEAIQRRLSRQLPAVIFVGDCRPAAIAATAAKSRSSTMRPIIAAMRASGQQQMGVWVPRELNTDPDLLSHPSNREAVEAAAVAAGWRVEWLDIPRQCWEVLLRTAHGEVER